MDVIYAIQVLTHLIDLGITWVRARLRDAKFSVLYNIRKRSWK